MPRRRSISSLRLLCALAERNISLTQVSLQSNFFSTSRVSTTWRTACRLAPHCVQNFTSSLWFEAHRGQNIRSSQLVGFLEDTTILRGMFDLGKAGATNYCPNLQNH